MKITFDLLYFVIRTNKQEDTAVSRINFIQIWQMLI